MPGLFNNPHVEEYFRRLNAPLQSLPAPERAEVHQELRQHLDALVSAHMELGATEDEAVRAALAQFGGAAEVGGRLRQEWELQSSARSAWPAFKRALACFGSVTLFHVALIVLAAFNLPDWPRHHLGFWLAYTAGVGVFGSPLLAGWATGQTGLKRVGQGIAGATLALAAAVGGAALLLSPQPDGPNALNQIYGLLLPMSLCQIVVWMPVGIAAGLFAGRQRGSVSRRAETAR